MAFQWMRRALLALAPAALLALAGCGSGTIESQFTPTRMIVFGDGLSDMGNNADGKRYTINDATAVWAKLVALDYGVSLDKSANGGTDYATGNARVLLTPDAAGGGAPTIAAQIDKFIATNGSFTAGDLVILQGGISDVVAQMQLYRAGTITSDQLVANVKQAGLDFAAQAKRVEAAGATHIVLIGMYDLSRTPWGTSTSPTWPVAVNQSAVLAAASSAFNEAVLVALVDEGKNMLYVDSALLFNLMVGNPAAYALSDVTSLACNSLDTGAGIGIGTGQVSSAKCDATTITTGVTYSTALWADAIYPTPAGHSHLADYTFSRVRSRW